MMQLPPSRHEVGYLIVHEPCPPGDMTFSLWRGHKPPELPFGFMLHLSETTGFNIPTFTSINHSHFNRKFNPYNAHGRHIYG